MTQTKFFKQLDRVCVQQDTANQMIDFLRQHGCQDHVADVYEVSVVEAAQETYRILTEHRHEIMFHGTEVSARIYLKKMHETFIPHSDMHGLDDQRTANRWTVSGTDFVHMRKWMAKFKGQEAEVCLIDLDIGMNASPSLIAEYKLRFG